MHDFVVGRALGVEVRAALAAAHGKGGEGVLENLLEAQELQHAQVHRGVEAQATLVGTDGRVELNAETTVDLDLALVIDPRHAELDDALGLDDALEDLVLLILGVCLEHGLERGEDLGDGLDELGLVGVLGLDLLDNVACVAHVLLLKAPSVSRAVGRARSVVSKWSNAPKPHEAVLKRL